MIRVETLVKIHTSKRTEFLQLFDMLKKPVNPIKGRLNLELFERVNERNSFLWAEDWENDQLLNLYEKEDGFRAMAGAINILGKFVYKKTFSFKK